MKNKLLASILTACMLLTMLPTAAFAAETEAEPGTEQTASGPENAGNQPDGGGDDAGDLITIEAVKLPMFPAVKSWKLR